MKIPWLLAPLAFLPLALSQPRITLLADSGWRFTLGDPAGAEANGFQDSAWRVVDLPHDWSIEGKPDKDNPTGAGGGFFPAGTGWYRKTFSAPAAWKGKQVSVEFEGVYRAATVYLNGEKLGTQPYGYSSFRFDLTPQLDFAKANVLAVRVDNSAQPNSRWYSGSGIYRHVRVVVTNAVHVAPAGVIVSTMEASPSTARLSVRTRVANATTAPHDVVVETSIRNQAGTSVASSKLVMAAPPAGSLEAAQQIAVPNPALWSPESPRLYQAVSRVMESGSVIDEVVTTFGIRTIAWSPEQGLLLNGKSIKLTGGSVHHDNGPLGAAAFDRAEQRRVELLKAAGHNAVRTAHNIPSPAFLDACDRIGIIVLDEPFDAWKAAKAKFDYSRNFDEWWQRDLSAMVERDRNHASIVMWGIGNEIPEAFVEAGGPMAKKLAAEVRSLDATRPLTQAFPGSTSGPSQLAVMASLDVVGYNYNLAQHWEEDHRRWPQRIMLTTESFPADAFEQWRLAKNHPFIVGEFVWTAMDYLGESGIGAWSFVPPEVASHAGDIAKGMETMVDQIFVAMANGIDLTARMAEQVKSSSQGPPNIMSYLFQGYPWHAANCGDIDLIGTRKPQSYYRDILWNGGDRVYATVRVPEPDGKKVLAAGWAVYPTQPSWTWPEQAGKTLQVEVYSGVESVRLYLNGKLIGEQPAGLEQQFKTVFNVPYAPGELKAVGVRGGRAVAESVLATVGKPARLKLTPDRTVVQADGQDLVFVRVEAVDAQGRWQPAAGNEVRFSISGPGVIAAVGNGDARDGDAYQGDRRKLFEGRGLVVVRTSKQAGAIRISAAAEGLAGAAAEVQSRPGSKSPAL